MQKTLPLGEKDGHPAEPTLERTRFIQCCRTFLKMRTVKTISQSDGNVQPAFHTKRKSSHRERIRQTKIARRCWLSWHCYQTVPEGAGWLNQGVPDPALDEQTSDLRLGQTYMNSHFEQQKIYMNDRFEELDTEAKVLESQSRRVKYHIQKSTEPVPIYNLFKRLLLKAATLKLRWLQNPKKYISPVLWTVARCF